jgi:hypothetical protein
MSRATLDLTLALYISIRTVYPVRTQFSAAIFHSKLYDCVISKVIDNALKLSLNTIATTGHECIMVNEKRQEA